jgi:hypothetical protein
MVSAAIAYDVLKKEDPKALATALDLLRQHPQYAERFTRLLVALPAEDRDLYLFMIAARWADDVRSNKEYHRSPWHYINYPFKPPGQPDEVEVKPPVEPNIVTAYAENLAILKGDSPAADKAIASAGYSTSSVTSTSRCTPPSCSRATTPTATAVATSVSFACARAVRSLTCTSFGTV